jgi:predicted ATP-dependent protease
MPVGGINEKIEGYFRVCQAMGLDGKQGVMIPKRNQRHLLLDADVIAAVEAGQFTIITIDHVLEGIAFLTGQTSEQLMKNADATLASYRKTLEMNQQTPDKTNNQTNT